MPVRQHDTRMLSGGSRQDRVDLLLPGPVLVGVNQHEFPARTNLSEELADLACRHWSIGAEADNDDAPEHAFGLEFGDDLQAGAELSAYSCVDVYPWQR